MLLIFRTTHLGKPAIVFHPFGLRRELHIDIPVPPHVAEVMRRDERNVVSCEDTAEMAIIDVLKFGSF